MPTHRLTDNEIQMVVCPQHKRWSLPQTIAGERLNDCVQTLHARIRRLDDACAAIESDPGLTEVGRRNGRAKLGAALLTELDTFKPYEQARNAAHSDVDLLEAKMTDIPARPTEVVDVMLAQEIRQWLRNHQHPVDVALKSVNDPKILGAILHAPPQLSGLDETQYNLLRAKARTSLHPVQTQTIAQLQKALGDLTDGVAAARRLICERTEVRVDSDGKYRGRHEPEPTPQLSIAS